jgi:hypothetical protein
MARRRIRFLAVKPRARKLALIPLLMLVLAACNGATLPATNVASSSAMLNGQASCGKNVDGSTGNANCTYYFRYAVGHYDNANNFSINYPTLGTSNTATSGTTPVRGPAGSTCGNGCTVNLNPENVTGLSSGTTYHYQLCGQGDDSAKYVSGYVCVGPDGSTSTSQTFTTAGPPPPETFARSAITVTAGSTVALHWGRNENEYFILTSAGANPLPNFQTAATFPAPGGTWQPAPYNWWVTSARAASLAIPANATAGSTYQLQLYTCNNAAGLCSNSSGSTTPDSTITITVAGSAASGNIWTAEPYTQQFSHLTRATQSSGSPLDVTFGGSNTNSTTIYSDNEFSNATGVTGPGQTSVLLKPDPSAPPSELGERVVSTPPQTGFPEGLVWYTLGGLFPPPTNPLAGNHSEIVAYDPNSGGFCTYQLPGNDNEVFGMAATGTGTQTQIWFDDFGSGQATVDGFSPSQVGQNCSNNTSYSLTGASSFEQISSSQWTSGGFPVMLAPDPTDGTLLWVTDFTGHAIDKVNTTTHVVTAYPFGGSGSDPWEIIVDSNYVYALDAGDTNLVRLNKANPTQIQEVPLPVTSDQESGYGLALSGPQGHQRLYFTLFDDPAIGAPAPFGAATTFGYVDLATWQPGTQPTTGVVFTANDLLTITNPDHVADFRGIAAASDGEIAIADSSLTTGENQVLRLGP